MKKGVPDDFLVWIAKTQTNLSAYVKKRDELPNNISKICGIDVSYKNNTAYCCVAIIQRKSFETVKLYCEKYKVTWPYIPGLFMLREGVPLINTLRKLRNDIDVTFVNGHGILHPRGCGLASYVGLVLDMPTIGIAKKLLYGVLDDKGKVVDNDTLQTLGKLITVNSSKFFVSIGHKVSLDTASKLAEELTVKHGKYPYPLYLADLHSKKFRKKEKSTTTHMYKTDNQT